MIVCLEGTCLIELSWGCTPIKSLLWSHCNNVHARQQLEGNLIMTAQQAGLLSVRCLMCGFYRMPTVTMESSRQGGMHVCETTIDLEAICMQACKEKTGHHVESWPGTVCRMLSLSIKRACKVWPLHVLLHIRYIFMGS